REDPSFALAHSWLAVVLGNGRDYESMKPLAREHDERALALSAAASPRERLRIEGNYYKHTGRADKAVASLEELVKIDTDDGGAWLDLAALCFGQGRIPDALRGLERGAALRPNDFMTLTWIAQAYASGMGDLEHARVYVQRAAALWPAQRDALGSELWR